MSKNKCLKIYKIGIFRSQNTIDNSKIVSIWNDDNEEDNNDDKKYEENELNFDLVQKILREYEILNGIVHPNIIKVYGFYNGDANHKPAILLEFCHYNLEKVIRFLNDIDLIKVIYQICLAMDHIHMNKIIHRDLKMTNILINKKKEVKICDFGISKVMDLTYQTSMTHDIGTILFMAPELFQHDSTYDEKVDVFAFGVVMFFILTKGELPKYTVPGNYEQLHIPKKVNKLSREIIKRCLSTLPQKRPSFKKIIKTITNNHFLLIDGIDNEIEKFRQTLNY